MTTMLLKNDHIALSSEKNIKDICAPLFKQSGINYFYYARIFDDGYCYLLSSNSEMTRYLFEGQRRIVAPISEEILQEKFYYLIPLSGKYQKIMHDARYFFNLAYPINFIYRQNGYIEIGCFTSDKQNEGIVNFYINNIETLDKFIIDFKEKARNLLDNFHNNKIFLPKHMRPNFDSHGIIHAKNEINNHSLLQSRSSSSTSNNKAISDRLEINNIRLCKRQTEISRLIVHRKTAKEIAKILGLSYRTVEYYLENIKIKTDSHSKLELIDKIEIHQKKLLNNFI